ncbi:glycerophosphodiester phosphodiesterase [Gillisia sp. M10.2A]|uniref:Glycerophosphodiester phosphodiesterase n=1 Tax=Gillisia lutea TaxID=2909668 RepID=A0ABS9ED18_9FLAO|nr:glycerophosphodiester phosphodiesterase family protein [Gillisia lutea]MCF4100790.1 glycerophosphodiester phosphodiesterase [Gillisia lutea]
MKRIKYHAFLLLLLLASCKNVEQNETQIITEDSKIEVQGHRGQRGHSPENSISGFLAAIEKGVDVVEMDVVMSKDGEIVVSHEPFMSSLYMLTPAGDTIAKSEELNYNLYAMTYDSIRRFDSGSKGNKLFPLQQTKKTYKPLLTEVIDSIESYVHSNRLNEIGYNIEIKSGESEYGKSQPQPKEFVKAIMNILKGSPIISRMNIQSFDINILEEMHKSYPEVKLAYLVGHGNFEENMERISFQPEIYSPHFKLLNKKEVNSIKGVGMKVIPWTVNEQADIDAVKAMGVNGIITDFPERVISQ